MAKTGGAGDLTGYDLVTYILVKFLQYCKVSTLNSQQSQRHEDGERVRAQRLTQQKQRQRALCAGPVLHCACSTRPPRNTPKKDGEVLYETTVTKRILVSPR